VGRGGLPPPSHLSICCACCIIQLCTLYLSVLYYIHVCLQTLDTPRPQIERWLELIISQMVYGAVMEYKYIGTNIKVYSRNKDLLELTLRCIQGI